MIRLFRFAGGARARQCVRWSAAIAIAAAIGVATACNGSTPSPSPAEAQAPMCPATPAATIGAACGVAGLRCGPEYTCGLLQVTLLCVCQDGTFQCTDGTGHQLDSPDAVICPPAAATSSCPATERSAQLASCTEQGLLCSYPSSCPSTLDACQCSAGTTASGGFGLRFECRPATCVDAGEAPAPPDARADADASLADVTVDAGTLADVTLDSATGSDATVDVPDLDVDLDADAHFE
jgi:hypothetical protein